MTKELRIEKQRYMYLHKDIQNEVIEVMAFRLLRDKNKSINKSAFIFVTAMWPSCTIECELGWPISDQTFWFVNFVHGIILS